MKILTVHNRYQQPGGEDVVVRVEEGSKAGGVLSHGAGICSCSSLDRRCAIPSPAESDLAAKGLRGHAHPLRE